MDSGVGGGGGAGDVVMPGVSPGCSDECASAVVVGGAKFVEGARGEAP